MELIGQFKVYRNDEIITFNNDIVVVGKNQLLDVMFNATAASSWYVSLISTLTTLSADDTMASHAGWSEYASYNEGTRPIWNPGAAAAKVVTNTTLVEFTSTETFTLKGIFIANSATKSEVASTLWCTAQLPLAVEYVNADVVKVKYTLTIR